MYGGGDPSPVPQDHRPGVKEVQGNQPGAKKTHLSNYSLNSVFDFENRQLVLFGKGFPTFNFFKTCHKVAYLMRKRAHKICGILRHYEGVNFVKYLFMKKNSHFKKKHKSFSTHKRKISL